MCTTPVMLGCVAHPFVHGCTSLQLLLLLLWFCSCSCMCPSVHLLCVDVPACLNQLTCIGCSELHVPISCTAAFHGLCEKQVSIAFLLAHQPR